MGVLRSMVSLGAEMEELRRTLRSEISYGGEWKQEKGGLTMRKTQDKCADENRTVCVTSGVSFLGFALVNSLLARGYTVKLTVETQEDLDKLGEMDMFGEGRRDRVWAVMTNLMNLDSLCCAFDGCVAVFHTSAFTDPSGVSGYSKHMAEMEARVAERVVEGCVRSGSVRKCVFTSSLLACVWRRSSNNNNNQHFSTNIIDENSWTDETLCRDRKLWFALGKTMAEKAAWRAARGRDLKLVTICPALITGPGFCRRSSTSSIAFLKGSQELFAQGLLATVDVNKVAEAHVTVYEAMHDTACGRYICYDHVIRRGEEAVELERQLGIPNRITSSETMSTDTTLNNHNWFELSNRKLSRLIFGSRHCSYDIYSMFCS